jgi:cell pole-organizing protein PopZ
MGEINQDPSMEEILASIKRVIAEDGKAAAARPARGSRPVEAQPVEGMLQKRSHEHDLDESIAEEDILELDDPVLEGEGLVSEDAADASRQSLAALLAMREQPEPAPPAPAGNGPLEAVVREMLKPMLKEWLDRNLPDMVEELVTREIARITGQRL